MQLHGYSEDTQSINANRVPVKTQDIML